MSAAPYGAGLQIPGGGHGTGGPIVTTGDPPRDAYQPASSAMTNHTDNLRRADLDMTLSSFLALLTATVSATAFLGLFGLRRKYPALLLLCGTSAITIGLTIFDPTLWSVEYAFALECICAALAVFIGLAAAPQGWITAAQVIVLGLIGRAMLELPAGEHWAYRGLAFVDVAAAIVLNAAHTDLAPNACPVARAATFRLRVVFALQAIYLSSWEFGVRVAVLLGFVTSAVYCWAMLGIAAAAAGVIRRPGETSASHAP